jgi:release factor glutamine methyltransferase
MKHDFSGRLDVFSALFSRLSVVFDANEAAAISRELFRAMGVSPVELKLRPNLPLDEAELDLLLEWEHRLLKGEPLHYIIGETEFMGIRFSVSQGVLIPRPETEELVAWILAEEQAHKALRVLDLGAGSGCIGLSIAKLRPVWTVELLENSLDALPILHENKKVIAPEVAVHELDMRNCEQFLENAVYDVWVSNPPYVLDSEKDGLAVQVKVHEPEAALFVPDSNPLYFYEYIAQAGLKCLVPGGGLYLETHRDYAEAVAELLRKCGYTDVQLRKDLYDNNRMVYGRIVS